MSTINVGPLGEHDLAAADHIMRLAFGTFLGLSEPTAFMGDAGYVRTRWVADSTAAFGARLDGELVGSNFATNWGSVGFFGPLTVHPAHWDRGIGSRLMEPVMELFARWGVTHAGLFTFAQSEKHVGLYQKFGFWPRFLTAIMAKPAAPATGGSLELYSAVPPDGRRDCLNACRAVTGAVYHGFDLEREICAVDEQGLGETVLIVDGSEVSASRSATPARRLRRAVTRATSRSAPCCPAQGPTAASPDCSTPARPSPPPGAWRG